MRPFIDGVTLLLWAWATWWIPLLLLFGIWKHGVRRVLEASAKGLWLMFFLFLPILLLRTHLYEWMTNPSLTKEAGWYLNTPGWIARWVVYFAAQFNPAAVHLRIPHAGPVAPKYDSTLLTTWVTRTER